MVCTPHVASGQTAYNSDTGFMTGVYFSNVQECCAKWQVEMAVRQFSTVCQWQLYVSGTSTGAILGKIVLISLCCGTRPFELCIAGASVGGGVS